MVYSLIRKRFFILFLVGLYSTTLYGNWQFGAYGELQWADLKGFQQTPKGGTPGSTSPERPSFSELNIDSESYFPFGLWAQKDRYQIGIDYFPLRYQGETTLSAPLTTHDISIPGGSFFKAETKDDLLMVSLSRVIQALNNGSAAAGLVVFGLDHHYEFQSGPFSSTRAFFATGIGVLLDYHYYLSKNYDLNIHLKLPIPVTNLDVYQAKLKLGYLWRLSNRLVVRPDIHAAWQKVIFKDNQTIPNHLEYRLSPIWGIGLSLIVI